MRWQAARSLSCTIKEMSEPKLHKLSREEVAKQLDVKPALLAQILPVSPEIAEPPRAKPVLQLVK